MYFFAVAEVNEQDLAARRVNAIGRYYSRYEELGRQVLILYGTEYGFSEEVARKLFDKMAASPSLQDLSVQPRIVNSRDYMKVDLSREHVVLCVFSTTGDGVAPTDSRPFFDSLSSPETLLLSVFPRLHYSVLALGDYNYTHFCRAGKNLNARYVVCRM